VTNQIQKDTRHCNEERIDKAGDEKEIYKLVKKSMETKDSEKVLKRKKNFLIEKILLHNSGIDQKHVKEPLREKMKQKTRSSARKL
jgi:hypothetical protein